MTTNQLLALRGTRAQMGTYFILIVDRLGVRPTHGFIVCGDGARHRIDNTEELRAWVLDLAGRFGRRGRGEMIPVEPTPRQCRPCGMQGHCGRRGCRTGLTQPRTTHPTVDF
jgi:CRISPR-associated exonuclease Cas4